MSRAPAYQPRFPPGPLLREIADLDEPQVEAEPVHRLAGARVVFFDHALLAHDFPELESRRIIARDPALARASKAKQAQGVRRVVEEWLLRNAALMSRSQLSGVARRVTSPIHTTGETVTAHRPPRYGRALVSAISDTETPPYRDRWYRGRPRGVLDLKGAGVAPGKKPGLDAYTSGLSSLYRILSDLFYQWLFDEIARRAAPHLWSVPSYAVLDLGFEILSAAPAPAGMQVRRAHRRPRAAVELPAVGSKEELLKFEVEALIRHYGLTSCTYGTSVHVSERAGRLAVELGPLPVELDAHREGKLRARMRGRAAPLRFDGVNVQLTRESSLSPRHAQLVDFGHYSVRDAFDSPLTGLARDRFLRMGTVVWPSDPHFVQPDPRVAIPQAQYSSSVTKPWAFDLALRFRAGEITGDEVRESIEARVRSATAAWD